ncbi:hypothetical protein CU102_05175 [Phyllobacterium brassicacearum]|uniref:Uncharacterized protein n=1 Tax=Phyllobacterium brassicacearum TaxID=314235 RepID=A0A2P7BTE8_9HYPH|nr:hypothetical protein [Phyllobacterium brassicacearum]PSH69672.1 hypothetical protein CU102_05175 [Phyllobacterium brassicacearum]TDQ34806.1 hypothetical protein DEV91_1024 [Phyllobacterium brassicacearum]
MVEITQELIYEVLSKIQGDVLHLKEGQREMRHDIVRLRNDIHIVQGDINGLRAANVEIVDRLDRIELRELAEAQARFEPHP